ncbi:hypothetical protein C6501_08035 [Candidatus Poribacteria bacterium]|nr:MAG: hypothetical protein C6501_08035 [Candidatus Poribacteria bacterium]
MSEDNMDIHKYLQEYKESKNKSDIELVRIESRIEERIKEVKTELQNDNAQLKTDLEKDIREVKTDLKDEIAGVEKYLRDDINGIRTRITALTVLGVTSLLTLIGFGITLIIRT